jgi:alkanesulfonate monooxygenase SsuD/methylene tetrahydromethanopterin reductase-like flavin-dependent oxidoreductase (luciferase family)
VVRFGVSVPPFTAPATVVRLAVEAEAAGWDGFFLWDHVRWSTRVDVEVHDPWVLLGAIATATDRVVLGPLVTPLSRRRPWVVAKQITTLDHLSGGRSVLGVGLGAPADADFADLGEVAADRERAKILDEALDVLDALLRGPTMHDGARFSVRTDLRPRPVQQPRPPIWVAGYVPHRRPLARARRWDGVVPLGSDEPLTPQALAAYLGPERLPGWDVVVPVLTGVGTAEFADAGATWLFDSVRPDRPGWVDDLTATIRRGPPVT